MPLKSTTVFLVFAAVMLGLNISLALAQTAAQHNGPGGPKDRVEKIRQSAGTDPAASAADPSFCAGLHHDRHLASRCTAQEEIRLQR
jgi:hypothetical protein